MLLYFNKSLFNRLYKCSLNSKLPFWNHTTDFANEINLNTCLDHAETELELARGDINLMIELVTEFIKDIFELTEQFPAYSRQLNCLQFAIATELLQFLTSKKLFNYSFDWTINAIESEITTNKARNFSLIRIEEFSESPDDLFIYPTFLNFYPKWAYSLFYYSRSTGGLQEMADLFLNGYLLEFCGLQITIVTLSGVNAMAQMAAWCQQLNYQKQLEFLSKVLFKIYSESTDSDIKKGIAFQFCCLDINYTPLSKFEWCETVKNNYLNRLGQHEEIQLLVNLYQRDVNLLLQHFNELILSINKYIKRGSFKNRIFRNYHFNRIYSILELSILTLISDGHVAKANKIITSFFDISKEDAIPDSNVYIVPNTTDGILYSLESNVIQQKADVHSNIPIIVDLENQFLGVVHMFNDRVNSGVNVPQREGVPDSNYANQYYDAVRNYFNFKALLNTSNISDCIGFYLFYGAQLPIQNIMSLELGFTLPLIHSFKNVFPPREIKEVYVWQGDTLLAESHRIGLENIFHSFGINTTFSEHFNSSKEEFITNYSDPKYNLIWVLCHGQYFHHEPHNSYLDLGSEIMISLEELPKSPDLNNFRRLLILDACDGATTSLTNSPFAIGLGTSVIDSSQSLLSHAWPIDNFTSLLVGLLYSIFLSQKDDYKTAHYKAISVLQKGKDFALTLIKEFCTDSDVIERIENKDLDYTNFIHWGSLTYIE